MANYAGDVQVYIPPVDETATIVFNYHDGSSRQSMGWLVAIDGVVYATNTANGHLGTGSTAQGVSLQKIQVPYAFVNYYFPKIPYRLYIKGTHFPETDPAKTTAAWKNRTIEKIIYNNRNCYILMSFGADYEKWVYACGDNTYSQLGTENLISTNYFTEIWNTYTDAYGSGGLIYIRNIVDICASCQSNSGSGNRVWHLICDDGDTILEIGCLAANGSQAVPVLAYRGARSLPAHPSGKKWVKIQSTSFTIWAIDEDYKLWCMGSNARGQFGDGTLVSSYLVWVNPSWATGGCGRSVFAIGGNANYETVCVSNGIASGVAIWGANGAGQVGDGSIGNSTLPIFYAIIGTNVVNGFAFSGGDESLNNAAVQTAIIVNNKLYVWGNGSDGGNAYGGITNTIFAPTVPAISQVCAYSSMGASPGIQTLNLTDLYGTEAVWDKLFTSGGRCGGFAITKEEYGSHLYAWGQGVNDQLGMDTAYGADGSNRFLRPFRVPQDRPITQIYGTSSVLSATAHGLCIARDSDGKILVSGSGKADQQVPVGVPSNTDVKQLRSVLINM